MDFNAIMTMIGTLGFPIVCALGMAWFIYKIYTNTTKENAANMEKVQKRCQEREDKLYEELAKSRQINDKAIDTIAHYAEKLDVIQKDIRDRKSVV